MHPFWLFSSASPALCASTENSEHDQSVQHIIDRLQNAKGTRKLKAFLNDHFSDIIEVSFDRFGRRPCMQRCRISRSIAGVASSALHDVSSFFKQTSVHACVRTVRAFVHAARWPDVQYTKQRNKNKYGLTFSFPWWREIHPFPMITQSPRAT